MHIIIAEIEFSSSLKQEQSFLKQSYQKQTFTSYQTNGISDASINNGQTLANNIIMTEQDNHDIIDNNDNNFSYNYNMCSSTYPVDCHAHECTAACSAYHVAVQDISIPVQETIQDIFQHDFYMDSFTSNNQVFLSLFILLKNVS